MPECLHQEFDEDHKCRGCNLVLSIQEEMNRWKTIVQGSESNVEFWKLQVIQADEKLELLGNRLTIYRMALNQVKKVGKKTDFWHIMIDADVSIGQLIDTVLG